MNFLNFVSSVHESGAEVSLGALHRIMNDAGCKRPQEFFNTTCFSKHGQH